jgi:hypothetical protein
MTAKTTHLDSEQAEFITAGVSILAAARDDCHETTVTRAVGCRVSGDRQRVTILLSASQSGALLADVRANGTLAVVFAEPKTHRAIQLKGTDAELAPLEADDPHRIAAYRARFAAQVASFGHSEAFVRKVLGVAPGDLVAIAFTPCGAFLQTPGPKAGSPLGSPAK